MDAFRYHSQGPQDTIALGARLARRLVAGDIVCLYGDLGAGKTTFTKGIARGLKIRGQAVVSPSFVLMNAYEGRLPLFHFDFYRITDSCDIAGIGYEEYLYGDGVAVIEWADRLGRLLPSDHIAVRFSVDGSESRRIEIVAQGARPRTLLRKFKK